MTRTGSARHRQGWLNQLFGDERARPQVPEGRRVFAVGDVHGRRDLLEELVEQMRAHADESRKARNVLVFLGDYVDRGRDSKGVIEYLTAFSLSGWETVYLRGNHDQAILDFLKDSNFYRVWRAYGARETLLSYGVTPPSFDDTSAFVRARDEFAARLPAEHVTFLSALKYTHIEGDYLFVHAGVRPGIALDQQAVEDLIWIRDDFLFSRQWFGKVVVHGHTPMAKPVKRANRINVDTGAYATGSLTAVVLEANTRRFLSTSGSLPMTA